MNFHERRHTPSSFSFFLSLALEQGCAQSPIYEGIEECQQKSECVVTDPCAFVACPASFLCTVDFDPNEECLSNALSECPSVATCTPPPNPCAGVECVNGFRCSAESFDGSATCEPVNPCDYTSCGEGLVCDQIFVEERCSFFTSTGKGGKGEGNKESKAKERIEECLPACLPMAGVSRQLRVQPTGHLPRGVGAAPVGVLQRGLYDAGCCLCCFSLALDLTLSPVAMMNAPRSRRAPCAPPPTSSAKNCWTTPSFAYWQTSTITSRTAPRIPTASSCRREEWTARTSTAGRGCRAGYRCSTRWVSEWAV